MGSFRLTCFISFVFIYTVALHSGLMAQDNALPKDAGYQFTEEFRLPATPVKNQYKSSTCWSYSTMAMLESELLRTGKGEFDLSEAFVVRHTYAGKAKQYVRFHGNLNFAGGGAFHDVMDVMDDYGMVPEEVYTGLSTTGDPNFVHGEMDEVFHKYVEGVVENKNRKLSPAWFPGFEGLLDAYLGTVPEKFNVRGKEFSPKTYAASLGLRTTDYIEIGSYTHHSFYTQFVIELPDNWAMGQVYNLPLDEMIKVIDAALEQGYTVGWGADISEKGFSWMNGVAVVPDDDPADLSGTERERWEKLTVKEKEAQLFSFSKPIPEKEITQEMRQKAFDDYSTTDDHGMQIIGRATDQMGNQYYIVKNSWGTDQKYKGYLYASVPYVKFKTISIVVNRAGIPGDIRKKLDL